MVSIKSLIQRQREKIRKRVAINRQARAESRDFRRQVRQVGREERRKQQLRIAKERERIFFVQVLVFQ